MSLRTWLARYVGSAAVLLLFASVGFSATEPAYRTNGGNEKLPWFELKQGEFPPEDAAHYLAGELIALDHVNRTGVLRRDRTDAIPRSHWDEPVPFTMLPYGALAYHGAPAELRDIPIGTHLHGLFFWEPKAGKDGKGEFTKVLRLEDDFSHDARHGRSWCVGAVDSGKGTLTVTSTTADAKPTVFQISLATRVWKQGGYGKLSDLTPGQLVFLNLTVCTLKGPGRCTDIWLDAESRSIAAEQQLEVHRHYQREHGLAGWIDEVDNQQGTVTATLFASFDPKLLEDFTVNGGIQAVVAGESLRTYDQINDRIHGKVLEIQTSSPAVGSSGVRIRYKPENLLEGFRPQRIVRLFSGKWKVDDLPKEEQLYK